jgi:lysophospholipid acyltransferase (LPLAT)-like uncharacterized protein
MVEVSREGASAFRVTGMRRVGLALVPSVMAALLRVLGATLRYETIVEPGGFEQRKDSAPGIYCFWHRSLLGAAHYFRNWRIAILISRSYDGELIARTVEKLGFTAVRGSSSRGGSGALLAAQKQFRSGSNVAFTADGPRGPVYKAKAGAVRLAEMTSAGWVGAFYVHPVSAWKLKSWDEFLIPKPFSRAVVSFARVVTVPGELNERQLEAKRAEVEAAVERARLAAERGHW